VRRLIRRLRRGAADADRGDGRSAGEVARQAGQRLKRLQEQHRPQPDRRVHLGWRPVVGERIRLLALGTARPAPAYPQLPTLESQGLGPYDLSTWNAMLAPAGTPPDRVAALAQAVHAALAQPALAARLAALGVEVPPPTGPAATQAFIAAEIAKFRAVADAAGLRLERP
jgi:hypothetical protein